MMMLRINIRAFNTNASSRTRGRLAFGKLSNSGKKILATQINENYYPDDPDGYDKEEYDLGPRKNQYYYKDKLLEYARKGPVGLHKALELFEDLKSKDRLVPHFRHFSLLIDSCAKVGYTQRAFELYAEFLRYNKKPSLPIVNSLINACSESPFHDYGLAKLKWFRDHLKVDQDIQLNIIHYNTMIKAYGKLCDAKQIEGVFEEMFVNNICPNRDTLNMLILACASNKDSGTILALSTFKRMKLYDFKPNNATYRLFLRCIRDCDIGSKDLVKKIFADLPSMTTIDQRIKLPKKTKRNKPTDESGFVWLPQINELKDTLISSVVRPLSGNIEAPANKDTKDLNKDPDENDDETMLVVDENQLLPASEQNSHLVSFIPTYNELSIDQRYADQDQQLPNLLSDDHLDLFTRIDSIQLDKTNSPQNRLMLFGGIHGFLETMINDGLIPCNKTFGLLLGCMQSTRNDIIEYYRLANDHKIKKDVPFYDMLIRHAAWNIKTKDRLGLALYLLERMEKDTDLSPNITTYESLAYACDNIEQATKLITDLESCGFTISSRLIRRLFDPPIFRKDFSYLNNLVELCDDRKYRPPKELIDKLTEVKLDAHDVILRYEQNILKHQPSWFDESQIQFFDKFTENLDKWLKKVDLLPDDHPWEQFYVERKSKRQGFVEFVSKFKALEQAKKEALEAGEELGNLMEKAEKILSAQKKTNKIIVSSKDRFMKNEMDDTAR